MAMNFIRENMNPKDERIGDCVLRAIAKLEEGNMTYDEILQRMKELSPDAFAKDKEAYTRGFVYDKLLKELGYTQFYCDQQMVKTRYRITSVNMASLFAKGIGKDVFAVTNNHAVAALKDGSFSDTWNSGRRRVTNIWFKDTDDEIKNIFKGHYQNHVWFERLPNGTVNMYLKRDIIAKFKNGERTL